MSLSKQDYQTALDVQGAVNLSMVAISFAEAMRRIYRVYPTWGHANEWRNRHPIVRLYTEAFARMSGSGLVAVDASWAEAHDFCTAAAAGHSAHLAITLPGNEVVEYEVWGDV